MTSQYQCINLATARIKGSFPLPFDSKNKNLAASGVAFEVKRSSQGKRNQVSSLELCQNIKTSLK
jgi:hypothetical protein